MELKQFSGVNDCDEFGNYTSRLVFNCYSGSVDELKSLLRNFRKSEYVDYCFPSDMPKFNYNQQSAVIVLYEDTFDSYYDYPKVSIINTDDISVWLSNFTANYDVFDLTEIDEVEI